MFKKIFFVFLIGTGMPISVLAQTNCSQNTSDSSCISNNIQSNINSNPTPSNAPIFQSCSNSSNQDSTCFSNLPPPPTDVTPNNNNSTSYTKNCKDPDVDSTCFQANILQYPIGNYNSLPICSNTNPGYYQNPNPPGGCLYNPPPNCIGNGVTPATWNNISKSWSTCGYIAPPQCPNGQNQVSAPYWDTLTYTWQGLNCAAPITNVYVCRKLRHPFWCGVGGHCYHWITSCGYVSPNNICVVNPTYSSYWMQCIP